MSIEYYYVNDLNRLFNEAVNGRMDDSEHLSAMMLALDNLEAHIQSLAHWRDTALQLSKNHGEAKAEIEDALNARIAELEAENAKLKAELRYTDDLLKEATETIGSVVACCTYNSDADAKIGTYGIDQKAFTRIDQFITHYNDAISAGKVSVDVKTSTDNNKGCEG